MKSTAAATAIVLRVTRIGFISGSLPRLCKFFPSRKSGQPTREAPAPQANMPLTTPSLYGLRNMDMKYKMLNVMTQR